jgi:hypothetical protein
MIYYNTSNVGIGTSFPETNLHIFNDATNSSKIIVQNNFPPPLPSEILIAETISTIIGVDRCILFPYSGSSTTKSYTLTTLEPLICDILVVGGGGGGGADRGGGGGGGGIIYLENINLNGVYNINVGKKGLGTTSQNANGLGSRGLNGENSYISGSNLTLITAIGGGGGGGCGPGTNVKNGLDGGSGGGGSQYGGNGSGGIGTIGQGKNGGTGYEAGAGGGGGGYVNPGTNASGTNAGNGGIGLSLSITGSAVIYSSGGGGGGSSGSGTSQNQPFGYGGSSGAGNGGNAKNNGVNATGYGCGGGGSGWPYPTLVGTRGGDGGDGVVIIRYRKTPLSSSSFELIRGSSGDANIDYKMGNYVGDFKIKSSTLGIDKDVLVINQNGNVGIGTIIPQTKLHLYDDITTETKLTIQNNIDITATPTARQTIGNFKTMIFTYTTGTGHTPYTINVPVGGVVCDILMVGGGGGGSHGLGGGGGAGAVVFIKSVVLNNNSYTIKVGAGGEGGTRSTTNFGGLKGNDTIITLNGTDILKAEGGGGAGHGSAVGSIGNGGSGGGGDALRDGLFVYNNGVVGTGSIKDYNGTTGVLYGNNGGTYYLVPDGISGGAGGGGGGAGQIGGNATKVNVAGNGGSGISSATINGNTYNFVDMFGTTYGTNDDNNNTTRYFGGGGGGSQYKDAESSASFYGIPASDIGVSTSGLGGKGGGGNGTVNSTNGFDGSPNTGGGGGGAMYLGYNGGAGGSGIVIIRYLILLEPSSSSSIELVRGDTTDANNDWTLGNYSGDFKIISSASGIRTDRLGITANGNVGIGTTSPNYRLHVEGTIRTNEIVAMLAGATSTWDHIRLWHDGSLAYIDAGGSSAMSFRIENTAVGFPASSYTERMRIASNGAVAIQNNGYALANNQMAAGSLTIGNQDQNYGGGTNWSASTAGLLMECADNTEIAVHDAGNSIHSFMRYTTNGLFTIGRNMGYGAATVNFGADINVAGNITAYYSDKRLKTKTRNIEDPLKIINELEGFYYTPNELAHSVGITNTREEIGLSAQDVQKILPELISLAPFDLEKDKDGKKVSKSGDNYLTMSYERLIPVLVEAIKELNKEIKLFKNENIDLKDKYKKLLEEIISIKHSINI